MANRLAGALSPYLLQHADNPVEWYPWGDEAFDAARQGDVPVLLSVGYAACHWCHVMAHESFEDPQVAAVMNELFVNVKVDREERPDVDAIYMNAVQLMTGAGGWPLTVFLTPDGQPFYGGTYFPPQDRQGMPGFPRVLAAIAEAWRERRAQVEKSAAELTSGLERMASPFAQPPARPQRPANAAVELAAAADAEAAATARLLEAAVSSLAAMEDRPHGGFGPAPKFPPHGALQFLLTVADERALGLAVRTLDAMARGGIADQLGGGYFRYSVDGRWHVPHFEKMLYDNAQLLRAHARAFALSGDERQREAAYGIVGWLEAEMTVTGGAGARAFISSLDADSEGEEGRFYAWREDEFVATVEAAGGDVALARAHFGVSAAGDFEGGNVLRVERTIAELAAERGLSEEEVGARLELAVRALRAARNSRVRPAADDKVLASWNGLAITALAEAGTAFADERLLEMAGDVARFVRANLWRDGRLHHVWRAGETKVDGLLEDYAFLGLGLVAYYRASLEPWALLWALEFADEVEERFRDVVGGGYFNTASDAAELLMRPKGYLDGATPSENAAAAELSWWAARYRSDREAQARALTALQGVDDGAGTAPQAFGTALRLLAMEATAEREIVLVAGADSAALAGALASVSSLVRPADVVLQLDDATHPLAQLALAEGRVAGEVQGYLTAYVCSGGVCDLPVHDATELTRLLGT
ncbi:MAG TPA: thioredoxin domain-containing protein [Trueperaceae bacterium]|nr:thioredoxin domain-containing protein [Trueperaceae bacterium]